jgi:hypothetical protein
MDFFPKFGGENTGLYGTLKAGNLKDALQRFWPCPLDPIPAGPSKKGIFFSQEYDS